MVIMFEDRAERMATEKWLCVFFCGIKLSSVGASRLSGKLFFCVMEAYMASLPAILVSFTCDVIA